MVGYSRLIGLDDAGTLRRLRTLRRALIDPAIREYGGTVVQTGGDSLLVAFDSIDGAVRCAVKVQQQVPVYDGDQPPDRRIRFRVGINTGDVIAHGTDLHGDGVNIAARLEAECPVGGICVSRAVRDQVHGSLDLDFERIGALTLKNIARPIEAFVLRLDPAAEASAPAAAPATRARLHASLVGGVVVLLLGAAASGAAWWFYGGPTEHPTPVVKSSASAAGAGAVFAANRRWPGSGATPIDRCAAIQNLSGDAKDDYLAEGITEDVTTDLSRVTGMFVIAREFAYSYRGKTIDVRKIGEELGVRYVLEGSVRKLGDALRVNAQLIATETGAHLWADRFDQKLDDMSAGQEAIIDRIGLALNVQLTDLETARSKMERPTNPRRIRPHSAGAVPRASPHWSRRARGAQGPARAGAAARYQFHLRDDRAGLRTGSRTEHRNWGARRTRARFQTRRTSCRHKSERPASAGSSRSSASQQWALHGGNLSVLSNCWTRTQMRIVPTT